MQSYSIWKLRFLWQYYTFCTLIPFAQQTMDDKQMIRWHWVGDHRLHRHLMWTALLDPRLYTQEKHSGEIFHRIWPHLFWQIGDEINWNMRPGMIKNCMRLKLARRSVSGCVGVCKDVRGTMNLEFSPDSWHLSYLSVCAKGIQYFVWWACVVNGDKHTNALGLTDRTHLPQLK